MAGIYPQLALLTEGFLIGDAMIITLIQIILTTMVTVGTFYNMAGWSIVLIDLVDDNKPNMIKARRIGLMMASTTVTYVLAMRTITLWVLK